MNTDNTRVLVCLLFDSTACLIVECGTSPETPETLTSLTSHNFAPMCLLVWPDLTHCNQLQGNEIQSRPGFVSSGAAVNVFVSWQFMKRNAAGWNTRGKNKKTNKQDLGIARRKINHFSGLWLSNNLWSVYCCATVLKKHIMSSKNSYTAEGLFWIHSMQRLMQLKCCHSCLTILFLSILRKPQWQFGIARIWTHNLHQ